MKQQKLNDSEWVIISKWSCWRFQHIYVCPLNILCCGCDLYSFHFIWFEMCVLVYFDTMSRMYVCVCVEGAPQRWKRHRERYHNKKTETNININQHASCANSHLVVGNFILLPFFFVCCYCWIDDILMWNGFIVFVGSKMVSPPMFYIWKVQFFVHKFTSFLSLSFMTAEHFFPSFHSNFVTSNRAPENFK